MADDMKRVVRDEQTIVAGAPQETVVTQTPAVVPGAVPGVVPVVQTTVATTPARGDQVVSHSVAESVVDPAAERAAGVDWLSRLIWFVVGLIDILLAIRFVLLVAGADQNAGFAQLIYGVTNLFVAPFAGLFGRAITYPGAAGTGVIEWESLVAIVVWSLVGFGLAKLADLLLGTNRNRGVVVNDINRNTRI
ncbi:MAG: YggT family protein [Chloroflexota bacterium]|nr:YggT family protein [Chloroflexota bacterium]